MTWPPPPDRLVGVVCGHGRGVIPAGDSGAVGPTAPNWALAMGAVARRWLRLRWLARCWRMRVARVAEWAPTTGSVVYGAIAWASSPTL